MGMYPEESPSPSAWPQDSHRTPRPSGSESSPLPWVATSPSQPPSERVGTVLEGRYELRSVLSEEGGMGVVYTAFDQRLEKLVALKMLLPGPARDASVVQRFQQEARLAARFQHPNVVKILDLGALPGGEPFLTMELLQGESLAQRLRRRGPLSPREALAYVIPVLGALAIAHRKGIVHRDLKPGNLFLASNEAGQEVPTLLDFGIAKVRSDERSAALRTRSGVAMGTVAYMAPEQARGASEVDALADQWSMGVVLFECLSGRLPFQGDNVFSMIAAVLTQPVPYLLDVAPAVPPGLAEVLARATAKDASRRFPCIEDFAAALMPWASEPRGESLSATVEVSAPFAPAASLALAQTALSAEVPLDPLPLRPSRGPAWWVGAALALLCAVTLSALHFEGSEAPSSTAAVARAAVSRANEAAVAPSRGEPSARSTEPDAAAAAADAASASTPMQEAMECLAGDPSARDACVLRALEGGRARTEREWALLANTYWRLSRAQLAQGAMNVYLQLYPTPT